ncbi:hypothetical protein ACFY1P_32420 [Streptomyces sp. NPDC001407]|uniref:hypothetical protein n=1 Tax=Streptomyces sp. NPDC001407 TaxID=3364573 RepID=UPI0036958471
MNAEQRLRGFYRNLARALELLAADAEEQVAYVSELGVGVDELALEFDDLFRHAHGLVASELIPGAVIEALRTVDVELRNMTDSSDSLWEEDAVRAAPEWRSLRSAARNAGIDVRSMGVES